MARKVIVQIGRLDKSFRNKISFSYHDQKGEAELSSQFLLSLKEFKGAQRILIFPKSIIFQDAILKFKDKEEFFEEVDKVEPNQYLKSPEKLLLKHPHVNRSCDLLVLSSFGSFKFKSKEIALKSNLEIITLQIYSYLISQYGEDDLEEIYIDISSGHNIYITALINALYRLVPFIKFKRFLHNENERINSFILNSDPIIPGINKTIKIQKSKFSAKAFNSFTYKNSTSMAALVKRIFKEKTYYNELYNYVKNEYFILHGSFIYSIPLMLSIVDEKQLSNLFDEIGIINILTDLYVYMNKVTPDSFKYQDSMFFSFTYALAIGHSVYFKFKNFIKKQELEFNLKEDSIENLAIKEISEIMHNMYNRPESSFLNELKMIYKDLKEIDNKETKGYLSGAKIKNKINPDYQIRNMFDPRNYFAHQGCELNCTELKIEENKLWVKYNGLINKKSILKYLKK